MNSSLSSQEVLLPPAGFDCPDADAAPVRLLMMPPPAPEWSWVMRRCKAHIVLSELRVQLGGDTIPSKPALLKFSSALLQEENCSAASSSSLPSASWGTEQTLLPCISGVATYVSQCSMTVAVWAKYTISDDKMLAVGSIPLANIQVENDCSFECKLSLAGYPVGSLQGRLQVSTLLCERYRASARSRLRLVCTHVIMCFVAVLVLTLIVWQLLLAETAIVEDTDAGHC